MVEQKPVAVASRSLDHDPSSGELAPALEVGPGDSVLFELPASATGGDAAVAGPVAVRGALPGDLLEVELVGVEADSGAAVTRVAPALSALDAFGDFEPLLVRWTPDPEGYLRSEQLAGVRVAPAPFPALIGLAGAGDAEAGQVEASVARGVRQAIAGSVWAFPVGVAGALLSVGDLRCAQGAGATCGAGIEAGGRVQVRLRLSQGAAAARGSRRPALTRFPRGGRTSGGRVFGATGIGLTVRAATEEAVGDMLGHLADLGYGRGEAAAICSAVLDLRISQMVNEPYVTVAALLPLEAVSR